MEPDDFYTNYTFENDSSLEQALLEDQLVLERVQERVKRAEEMMLAGSNERRKAVDYGVRSALFAAMAASMGMVTHHHYQRYQMRRQELTLQPSGSTNHSAEGNYVAALGSVALAGLVTGVAVHRMLKAVNHVIRACQYKRIQNELDPVSAVW